MQRENGQVYTSRSHHLQAQHQSPLNPALQTAHFPCLPIQDRLLSFSQMDLSKLHYQLKSGQILWLSFRLSHPILTHTQPHLSLMPGPAPYRPLPQVILLPARRALLRDGQPVLALLTCNQELLEPPDGLSRLTPTSDHSCSSNRVFFHNPSKALRSP